MMKYLFLFLCALFCNYLSAQDLIVTTEGDSIPCKITKIDEEFFHFKYRKEQKVDISIIPREKVSNYKRGVFLVDKAVKKNNYKAVNQNYTKFRLGFYSGYSIRTVKIASGINGTLKSHLKKMKSGYHIAGTVHGFVSENTGIGLEVRTFNSNANSNLGININGPVVLDQKDNIFYIAPSYLNRIVGEKGNVFSMSISMGYMEYNSKQNIDIERRKVKGGTFGLGLDVGYDIPLSKKILVGSRIAYLGGVLSKLKITTGGQTETITLDDNNKEGLARLDFSLGLTLKL